MTKPTPLTALAPWQQTLYATAMAQGLLPHWRLYAQLQQQDESAPLGALEMLWTRLLGQGKGNPEVQLTRLEPLLEQLDDASFGGQLARDALLAIMAALQCAQNGEPEEAQAAADLSLASVAQYLAVQAESGPGEAEQEPSNHPLWQAEVALQAQLLEQISRLVTPKPSAIKALKELAQRQGASPIGVTL